jgi:Ser/Thr protein kinase RdoA (MazF antagonist)
VNANPADEEIETSLQECGVDEGELPALSKAARSLFAQVAAQPKGLLHQDFMHDNLGWRGEEMVVFDVHKNALGPRFADVAPYLGLPDWSSRAAFLDAADGAGSSRREALTQHYLAEYARFGGETVSVANFLEEARALFWTHKVSNLWWLRENKEARVDEMLHFLRRLAAKEMI